MIEKIVCKVWNSKYQIGILPNGNYIGKVKDKIKPVLKEVHLGSVHYRCIGSDKRVSAKRLNDKKLLVTNFTLQEYCPF